VIIPTNYAAVVMAEAKHNPFNQPVESYLGNTLLSWFAQSGNLDPVLTSLEAQHDAQVMRDLLASGPMVRRSIFMRARLSPAMDSFRMRC
jgi:hypothetical protein